MPKLDVSIYKGFLHTLENARIQKNLVTLHFFREPVLRGYIEDIDKEVYVATVITEQQNCVQIRLSQITSIMWQKNGQKELTPKSLNQKNRIKNIEIEKNEREKLEEKEESFMDYAKKNPQEKEKELKLSELSDKNKK